MCEVKAFKEVRCISVSLHVAENCMLLINIAIMSQKSFPECLFDIISIV